MQATDHALDLLGLKCPLPALKTAKFLKGIAAGETVRVLCSDPMAAIDIPNLIRETGDVLLDQRQETQQETQRETRQETQQEATTLVFVIRKGGRT